MAYESTGSAADETYQNAVAADQAAYDGAYGTAWATLQSALTSDEAAYDIATAAAVLALSSAQTNADAAYNAVANDPDATASELSDALAAYEATMVSAYEAEITQEAAAAQTASNNDATAQDVFVHAIDADAATQQQNDAAAAEAEMLAIDSAEQTQLLADTAAETAYQIQLDSLAETKAINDAAADLALSLAVDAARATQSNADAAVGNTDAHAINGLTQQYELALGDAYTAKMKSDADAMKQEETSIDGAAITAWNNWAGSGGNPYATYQAAINAASYSFDIASTTSGYSASMAYMDASNQWNHDVAGGWLTYHNDQADHAKTRSNTVTTAATLVTNTLATDANTFATTVAPAIQTAADAEVNAGNQAIITASSATQAAANAEAADALAAVNAQATAAQEVSDIEGDAAKQKISEDSTAFGAIFTYAMNALSQSAATLAISDGPTPGQQVTAAAANQAKAAFTRDLKDVVDDSRLGDVANKLFYVKDTNKKTSWFGYVVTQQPKTGFDCDDYADAMYNYLSRHFVRDDNISISVIDVFGVKNGESTGHNMIVVQNGQNYWLVDPQYSLVKGPYASLNAVSTIAVPEIMTGPNYYRYSSITRTEYSPNRQLWQAKRPGEPQPWHTDPAIRTRFENVLRGISGTVNVDNYYPQKSVPVQEIDPNPSGLDAAAFFSR